MATSSSLPAPTPISTTIKERREEASACKLCLLYAPSYRANWSSCVGLTPSVRKRSSSKILFELVTLGVSWVLSEYPTSSPLFQLHKSPYGVSLLPNVYSFNEKPRRNRRVDGEPVGFRSIEPLGTWSYLARIISSRRAQQPGKPLLKSRLDLFPGNPTCFGSLEPGGFRPKKRRSPWNRAEASQP